MNKDAADRLGSAEPKNLAADLPAPDGLLIDQLTRLPEKAILDAARLAGILRVTARTVRRMVLRHELPAPIRLAGRSVWFAGKVLAHIEAAVERAEREAERQFRRTQQLSP